MGMERRHDPKATVTPAGVQTGMNWIEGKKQDKDCLVKVSTR
jgi:hypothetical protein